MLGHRLQTLKEAGLARHEFDFNINMQKVCRM